MEKYTFAKLIQKYKIIIPTIQRDYAQGRNTRQAIEIRENIIDNIYNALIKEGSNSVDFDYIYGRVENNEEFIPIDGQQRLTTLFLLHLYLGKCIDKNIIDNELNSFIAKLTNFSYETRISSKEFCKKITSLEPPVEILGNNDDSPEKFIKNQPWFYPEWTKDPTIASMLRTLNTIHAKFKGISDKIKIFRQLITTDDKIYFHFKNLGCTLTDEIYLKMNARHLPLTSFEIYKAKLEQYIGKIEIPFKIEEPKQQCSNWKSFCIAKKISWKFDNDWLLGFWNHESEKTQVSSIMMSVIANIFRSYALIKMDKENEKKKDNSNNCPIAEYFKDIANGDKSFVSFDNFQKILEITKHDLLENLFSFMENLYLEKYNENVFPNWFPTREKKEYDFLKPRNDKERAILASLVFYGKITNENNFKEWLRVICNIIENTDIDNNFSSAIKLIDELSNYKENILDFLANNGKIKSNYAIKQLEEEREKAKKIMGWPDNHGKKDEVWYESIKEAENYAFFHGSIRFLYLNDKGLLNWDNYGKKLNNAKQYFDDKGVKKEFRQILAKAFIIFSTSKQIYNQYIFSPAPDIWRKFLISDTWMNTIHSILSIDNIYELEPINQSIEDEKKWVLSLPLDWICDHMPNSRLYYYQSTLALYNFHDAGKMAFVYLPEREILFNNDNIKIIKIHEEYPNSYGWDITFEVQNRKYIWSWDNKIFQCNNEGNELLEEYKREEITNYLNSYK